MAKETRRSKKRSFPAAEKHGELRQLFDDVFFVSGSITMNGPVSVAFSRNMTVIRDGEDLTLINTMRLDEAGLTKLDELGNVKHVIRIAGFHGRDDPFYKDRYDATVWTIQGQVWARGFDATKPDPRPYFEADEQITADSKLPIPDATAICIEGTTPEGMILLERHGGILVTGDALQNWQRADDYFSFLGKTMMKVMGFIKPYNVGPGWLKGARPKRAQLAKILEREFEHVLPAHGFEVMHNAREKFEPAIRKAT